MTPDRVDEMLKSYRYEVGRCKHLETEIDLLTKAIERGKTFAVSDLVGPGAQVITDMPRGTGLGNPTEMYGMMLADGWQNADIADMENDRKALQAEYDERHKTVAYVESWLAGLNDRERWIIEMQVIDSVIWREILNKYQQTFGEYRSKDTLKRIRDKALDTIYDIAE